MADEAEEPEETSKAYEARQMRLYDRNGWLRYIAFRYARAYLGIIAIVWALWILAKSVSITFYYVALLWCTERAKITTTFQQAWVAKLDEITNDEKDPFKKMEPMLNKWEMKIEDTYL